MAEVAKKTAASDREQTGAQPKSVKAEPLENMPERPKTIPHKKTERLFCAWTGELKTGATPDDLSVTITGIRVFGVKAECTEFAVDQEPAWKWVETTKDADVVEAIIEKAKAR